ncbi:MAG: hypothetical protein ACE5IP_03925 [Terriglobia bacterium]
MVLQLSQNLSIENLRNHSAETVEKLRGLLAAGALAHADPRRQNFYELENGRQIFYVHVVPQRSKVLLLATWDKDCPAAT